MCIETAKKDITVSTTVCHTMVNRGFEGENNHQANNVAWCCLQQYSPFRLIYYINGQGVWKSPNSQVFTLRRWIWYRRSDTQLDSPSPNKPQDAVHLNSHAAQSFCLRSRPHTQLFVDQRQSPLTSDRQGAWPEGSWSGRCGPAGQRSWMGLWW